jgi:hypothetical protein
VRFRRASVSSGKRLRSKIHDEFQAAEVDVFVKDTLRFVAVPAEARTAAHRSELCKHIE